MHLCMHMCVHTYTHTEHLLAQMSASNPGGLNMGCVNVSILLWYCMSFWKYYQWWELGKWYTDFFVIFFRLHMNFKLTQEKYQLKKYGKVMFQCYFREYKVKVPEIYLKYESKYTIPHFRT